MSYGAEPGYSVAIALAARVGKLGQIALRIVSIALECEHERREIGLREVPVVVASLFRPRRAHLAALRRPRASSAARRCPPASSTRALARELDLERALDAGERIHVLDFGLGAELRLARACAR